MHGIFFSENGPQYVNQWIKTEIQMLQQHTNKSLLNTVAEILVPGIKHLLKTLLRITILERLVLNGPWHTTANTALVYHNQRLLALNEGGPPTEITAPHFGTVGIHLFKNDTWGKDTATKQFSAHPKVCPVTKEL